MYIFYPDVYFLSQMMTGLYALMIVRVVFNLTVKKRTLLVCSSIFGLLSTIAVLLIHPFDSYSLFVHIFLVPTTVFVSCRPREKYEFAREIVTSYVALWMLYGCMEWITIQTGWSGNVLLYSCAIFLYLAVFVALKIRKRLTNEVEVILKHGEAEIRLKGYIDTGNMLIDPYSRKPVHVVSKEEINDFLKKANLKNYCLIPYETVAGGQLMECYYVECMILLKKYPIVVKNAAIGLSKHQLFQRKTYQMLVNSSQMNE